MKRIDFKKVIGWLGFILRCPICGFKYNLDNTQVLESKQEDADGAARILIHSDCQKCKSSVMFNIDIDGPEIFSVGMVTDLTRRDSTKFSKLSAINTDDCIKIHQGLQGFNGDFVKALAK
jgi:hypothetical protein